MLVMDTWDWHNSHAYFAIIMEQLFDEKLIKLLVFDYRKCYKVIITGKFDKFWIDNKL